MKVITICGSYKFKKEMVEIAECMTLEGNCVLMPNELSRTSKDKKERSETGKLLSVLIVNNISMVVNNYR